MLVKITTRCSMGCSHCMEDASPDGVDMSLEVFRKARAFVEKVYGSPLLLLLSGGEPTDHPQFLEMTRKVSKRFMRVIVLSNGLFLLDERRDPYLLSGALFQITNDDRFYPKKIESVDHPLMSWEQRIRSVVPFGRAKGKIASDRRSPLCFNLRSALRHLRDFKEAVLYLRQVGKMCIPHVDVEGNVRVGECRSCFIAGRVDEPLGVIASRILSMECNRCGLEDNLTKDERGAIGLS